MTTVDIPIRHTTSKIVVRTFIVLAILAAVLVGVGVFLAGGRIKAVLEGERDIGHGLKMFYPGGGAYIMKVDGEGLVPSGTVSWNGGSVGEFARVTLADCECYLGTIVDRSDVIIGYFTLRTPGMFGERQVGFRVREYTTKAEWDKALLDLGITTYRLRRA